MLQHFLKMLQQKVQALRVPACFGRGPSMVLSYLTETTHIALPVDIQHLLDSGVITFENLKAMIGLGWHCGSAGRLSALRAQRSACRWHPFMWLRQRMC